jgi:hypothetical protein
VRDIDVFARLLTLKKPWKVEKGSVSSEEEEVHVWLQHREGAEISSQRALPSVVSWYDAGHR